MLVTNEIASITILVPCKRGNEIINQIVPFKVFKEQKNYTAMSSISNEQRNIIGLSAELSFKFIEHRIIPETNEANMNATNNIASELKMPRIV